MKKVQIRQTFPIVTADMPTTKPHELVEKNPELSDESPAS
jgi:hypothetical protein